MSEKLICPVCGAENDSDDSFCSRCGAALSAADMSKADAEVHGDVSDSEEQAVPAAGEEASSEENAEAPTAKHTSPLQALKARKAAKSAKSASIPIDGDAPASQHAVETPVLLTPPAAYNSDDPKLTVVPEKKPRTVPLRMVLIIAGILLLAIIIVVLIALPPKQAGRTPAGAVKAFVRELRGGDAEAALALFATESKNSNFDFEAFINNAGVYSLSQPAPNDSGFYSELNSAYFSAQAAREIKTFAYSLLLPSEFFGNFSMTLPRKEAPAEFSANVSVDGLSGLRVVRVDIIEYTDSAAAFKAACQTSAAIYGTLDREDVYVLLQLDGNYYAAAITVVKTEKGWQIDTLNALLPALTDNASAKSVTRAEYDQLVKNTK